MSTSWFLPPTVVDPYTLKTIPVTVTSDIIWASYDPKIQALRGSMTLDEAIALSTDGYKIDMPIMVWNWDAALTMEQRLQSGYTWVPAADQAPVLVPPFLVFPNEPVYDPNSPPAGSIKVSVNAADFPPAVPPPTVVVPPPSLKNLVGNGYGDGKNFYGGPGAMLNSLTPAVTDGEVVTEGGKTYTAHVVRELMGYAVYFTLQ